ncbi:MAG: hypothetical protein LBE12_06020 [Planctomycetaceae bacterium]|jgi:hypothetical protein|nr:hypothetical protein [Planctomycetaceae bacterium]
MQTYNELTSDHRLFSGSPAQRASIRERLHRQYNIVLEEDLPVHPTLDSLLYGSNEDQAIYDMPLFFQHTGADTRELVSGCSPEVGAVGPPPHKTRKY